MMDGEVDKYLGLKKTVGVFDALDKVLKARITMSSEVKCREADSVVALRQRAEGQGRRNLSFHIT